MVRFDRTVPVTLEFRGMSSPVSVEVPVYVMRYLDIHAERIRTNEGEIIYRQPSARKSLPQMRVIPLRMPQMAA